MADQERAEQKIRHFFDGLSPRARELLASGLERRATRLAAPDPPPAPPSPRPPDPPTPSLRESFLAPIKPFLMDGGLPAPEPGRVARPAAERIWRWFERDLAPDELASARWQVMPSETELAELRRTLLSASAEMVAQSEGSAKAEQRLSAQIGGDRAFRDLGDLIRAFAEAERLRPALAGLPPRIGAGGPDWSRLCEVCLAGSFAAPHSMPWLFSALLHHVETPVVLVRLAVALAGTDDAARLADSAFAPAIAIALSEIDLNVARLQQALDAPGPAETLEALLRRHNDVAKELVALLDLPAASAWGRRLATARALASARLEQAIAPAAGLARRIMRAHGVAERGEPDDADIEEAVRAARTLRLVMAARDSLALNRATQALTREMDQTFEVLLPPLFEALRTASGERRTQLLRRTDAAVRIAEAYFGRDHASHLERSRQAAAGWRPGVSAAPPREPRRL